MLTMIGLSFVSGAAIGTRFSAFALIVAVPLVILLALALSWGEAINLDVWGLAGLVAAIEAGFLLGGAARSIAADRRSRR